MSVRRIVVGTDGSAGAAEAVRWTASLAAALEATVDVVHAVGLLTHVTPTPEPSAAHVAEIEELAEVEWVEPLRAAGVACRCVVRPGHPAHVILAVAAEVGADMIVIGHRGQGGTEARHLGSTAHEVAEAALVPVVVVPVGGGER